MSYDPPPGGSYPPPPPVAPTPGTPRPGELVDRFVARLIDNVILGVVFCILSVIVGAILGSGTSYTGGSFFSTGTSWAAGAVTGVIFAVLAVGYFAYLESSRGQTIGKQVMKLTVVGPDGVSKPTLEQAAKRNIWMAINVAAIIPIIGGCIGWVAGLVAVITIAVGINGDTVNRQAWNDKFAGGTRVLKIG